MSRSTRNIAGPSPTAILLRSTKSPKATEITADPNEVPKSTGGYRDYQHQIPEDWQSVRRVAPKRGQGFTTMPLAEGPPFLFRRRGTSFNSYSKLLARLAGKPAFKLITQAHAVKLEWDGQKKKAVAVSIAIYAHT